MSTVRRRRRERSPRRDTTVGLLVLLIGVVFFYLSLTKQIPFFSAGGQLVTVRFSEPNQLEAGQTPVRIDGVDVGVVDSVSAADGGRYGKVVLRITDNSVVLHSDARAEIKFRTLLGANFVVDLNPGSPSAPALGPAGIPLAHTSVQVEFDDALGAFHGRIPLATRVDVKQLAAAMKGIQLGHLIDVTAPSLVPTPPAFQALQGVDPSDLAGMVRSASAATSTLAADKVSLENLIRGGDATLGATSGERVALGETLDQAPPTLVEIDSVSHSVEGIVKPANALLTALGPGARALAPSAAAAQPAVTALRSTLDHAEPLLHSLRPAVAQLSAASAPGIQLIRGVTPTIARLNGKLIPWLQSDDSALKRPIYQLVMPTFAGLGSAASEYDTHAHVIHFPIQPEADSVPIVPCTVFAGAPTPGQLVQCDSLDSVLEGLL